MRTGSEPLPILVAGGGIGGLAAAIGLARSGHRVRVFEQASDFGEIGAGLQLGPNGLRALEYLGVGRVIRSLSWEPEAWLLRDGLTGEVITRIVVRGAFPARFGQSYIVLHRADLLETIFNACIAHPHVTLERRSRVTSFRDDGESVTVELEDGRSARGAALIGADGIRSAVRQQIIGDGAPPVTGLVAYRAVLRHSEVPEDLWSSDVVMWAGPKADIVHYPLRGGSLFNLIATYRAETTPDVADIAGDRDALFANFRGYGSHVMRFLDMVDTERRWIPCYREPTRGWSRGRATLLGDAAHPMIQYLAQGACQALEDAVRLAQEVARAPGDFAAAFAAYEAARGLRTARAQLTAKYFEQLFHLEGVLAEMRAQFLRSRSVAQICDSFAWLYEAEERESEGVLVRAQ
jgi:salicylate hydroxylase